MKKNKLIIYSLMFLLFATFSCQYEEAEIEKDPLANVNPLLLKHDLSAYKIKPIWESAVVFKKGDVVEMNFKADNKIILPMSEDKKIQGRQRLLLTIEKGIIRETVIEYIPANTFVGDIKYIHSGNFKVKKFDGKVTIKNIKDDFKMVWYLTKGEIVKKAMQYKNRNNANNRSECTSVVECVQHPGQGDMECSIVMVCAQDSDPYDSNTDPYGPNYDPWIGINQGQDPYGSCEGPYCDGNSNPNSENSNGNSNVNAVVVVGPTNPVADVSIFLNCINETLPAKVSVYCLQPIVNNSASHDGSYVGHTFISIVQGGVKKVIGFYPVSNWITPLTPSGTGIYGNDTHEEYNTSISTTVNSAQLTNIINYITTNASSTYNLNTYNCTDFGIGVGNLAGLGLPDGFGTWPGGSGSNPGALGQYIRSMSGNTSTTSSTNLYAPVSSTCP